MTKCKVCGCRMDQVTAKFREDICSKSCYLIMRARNARGMK